MTVLIQEELKANLSGNADYLFSPGSDDGVR